MQVDVEAARTVRPECSLNISACTYNGSLVTTVSPVLPLTFAVIQPYAFELGYVGLPATNLVSPLASNLLRWMKRTVKGNISPFSPHKDKTYQSI